MTDSLTNRDKVRAPRKTKFYCPSCDRAFVSDGGKCPICGKQMEYDIPIPFTPFVDRFDHTTQRLSCECGIVLTIWNLKVVETKQLIFLYIKGFIMPVVNCRECKQPFTARAADIKRGWGKFCSKRCKAINQERHTGQYRNLNNDESDNDLDLDYDDESLGDAGDR